MPKAKTAPEPKLEQMCFDIRKDQKEAMEKIRTKTGSPVSFQIRTAIDLYLKNHK